MKNSVLIVLSVLVAADIGLQIPQLVNNVKVARSAIMRQDEAVRPVPSYTRMELANLPTQGSGKVVLVEFSDFECPFCRRHATQVFGELQKQFVTTGKIRYAFANNPLVQHPNARPLAIAAICAGKQHHFWEMHDILFSRQPGKREEIIGATHSLSGINVKEFEQCLDSEDAGRELERDIKQARELGLTPTPSFALGRINAQGTISVEKIITGARPIELFEAAINEMTNGQTAPGS